MITYTAQQLHAMVKRFAPQAIIHTPDAAFDCPSKDWLMGEYAKWFAKARWDLDVSVYQSEINDCDDAAAAYRVGCQIANAKRGWKNRLSQMFGRTALPNPLAVAEIWYKTKEGGGHAINMAYVNDPAECVFVEPQTGKEVQLTRKEMESIFFVRF